MSPRRALAVLTALSPVFAVFAVFVVFTMSGGPRVAAQTQTFVPTRVLDTRNGLGGFVGTVDPGETVRLTVPGVPAGPSTALFLNVTTVDAREAGHLSVWPCDAARQETSIVNYEAGRAVPNMAVVAYPAAGVCFASVSSVHLVVDLTAVSTAGEITGIAPNRLLDTRHGGRLTAGSERSIPVAGTRSVPANAAAAAVNVTIVSPAGPGYAVVKPCGAGSDASTVNFLGGEVVAHFTFVTLSAGAFCVVSSVETDVVVDAFGWMDSGSPTKTVTPGRLLDTRTGEGGTRGAVRSGQTVQLRVAGRRGVPAGADVATLNTVADGVGGHGYVTLWPCDNPLPTASTLNLWPGGLRANQATIPLSGSGDVCLRPWLADGSAIHLVVDAVGYVEVATPVAPPTVTPPSRFLTVPVGAPLPTGSECAARVRQAPEVRPENAVPNANRGGRQYANTRGDWSQFTRVDGDFAGTTDEIIQWAACKWGIDEDIARAQIIKESYWYMSSVGDGGESFGLGQVRITAHPAAFQYSAVNARNSSAYNLDYTFSSWRACFEGVYTWLNTVERNGTYAAGDVWGCVGLWFSGRWYVRTDAYLNEPGNSVRWHYENQTWTRPEFVNHNP